jgi:hypothetical protein
VRSKKFKQDVEPGLKAFFATVVCLCRDLARLVLQESGCNNLDSEDMKELDPEFDEGGFLPILL